MSVLAYKFLDEDGCAPFTKARWHPGEWIEASRAEPCHDGVHACRVEHLAYWAAAELWQVELDGTLVEGRHKLAGSRGRLVRRIDGYVAARDELAEVGAWRARDRTVVVARSIGAGELAGRLAAAGTIAELIAVRRDSTDDRFLRVLAALAVDTASYVPSPREALFVAACSAGHAAAGPAGDQDAYDAGYAAERSFQSAWLAARLGLA